VPSTVYFGALPSAVSMLPFELVCARTFYLPIGQSCVPGIEIQLESWALPFTAHVSAYVRVSVTGRHGHRVSLPSFSKKTNRHVDHNHDYYDLNQKANRHFAAS